MPFPAAWLALAVAAAPLPVLEVRGSIDPGTADYIVEAIRDAEAADAPAVVIRLDTPGGLLTSTREIVQAQLSASIPVIVWVEPAGGRAGSAGTFVTMAGHVAAMAPGTTIGAAHPLQLFGETDAIVEEKALQDTTAWARAIAERRGRNADWAELAVRESAAATDVEALALDVVDVIAADLDGVLLAIDGWTVQTAAGPVVLDLSSAEPTPVAMTLRQQVVHVLGDPNVVFFLGMLGLLGLWMELQNPGLILPGALGATLLVAAGIGLSIVPFHAGGVLLLLLGFVLITAEIWVQAAGALAITGLVALAAGGLLLFEAPGNLGVRVDPRGLVVVIGTIAAIALLFAVKVVRAQRTGTATGAEGLVGAPGEVLVGGDQRGRVWVEGEDWAASWPGRVEAGTPVSVVRVDGLILEVVPHGPPTEAP